MHSSGKVTGDSNSFHGFRGNNATTTNYYNSNWKHSNDIRSKSDNYDSGNSNNKKVGEFFRSENFTNVVYPEGQKTTNNQIGSSDNRYDLKERKVTYTEFNRPPSSSEEDCTSNMVRQIITNDQQQTQQILAKQELEQQAQQIKQIVKQQIKDKFLKQLQEQQQIHRIANNLHQSIAFIYNKKDCSEKEKFFFTILHKLPTRLNQLPPELKAVLDLQLILNISLKSNATKEEIENAWNRLNLEILFAWSKLFDPTSELAKDLSEITKYLFDEIPQYVFFSKIEEPVQVQKKELVQGKEEVMEVENNIDKFICDTKQKVQEKYKDEERFPERVKRWEIKTKQNAQISERLEQLNFYIVNNAKNDALLMKQITPLLKLLSNVEEQFEQIPERLRPLLGALLDLLYLHLQGEKAQEKHMHVSKLINEACLRPDRQYERLLIDLRDLQLNYYLLKEIEKDKLSAEFEKPLEAQRETTPEYDGSMEIQREVESKKNYTILKRRYGQ